MTLYQRYAFLLKIELLMTSRNLNDLVTTLLFFIVVASLFPFAISHEQASLRLIGPGVIWVVTLLATMLSMPKLFKSDYSDGSLEDCLLSERSLALIVLIKCLAHWLIVGGPLLLITPLLGFMYYLSVIEISVLMLTLLLGMPVLIMIGAFASALTVGLKQNNGLVSLLVLPLTIPVLIFASGAVILVQNSMSPNANIALLSAMFILALVLVPPIIASALRTGTE